MRTLTQLTDRIQSPWCDNLSKSLIESGELQSLIDSGIRGVTSNPTIFDQAISNSEDYTQDLKACKEKGMSAEESYWELVCNDIRNAADILKPTYEDSNHRDGYVSVEVSPLIARNTVETIAQANELYARISRDNVMIKIPATLEGLEAITAVLANSIPVNVTLIFSQERYAQVIDAYKKGIANVTDANISALPQSVASFFISRLDTKVDSDLPENSPLLGKAAISNAAIAYEMFINAFETDQLANAQRPLWASTGTKNPEYSDVLYVDELIAKHSVNTLPQKTIDAILSKEEDFPIFDLNEKLSEHKENWEQITSSVDIKKIMLDLENEGVKAFEQSYESCLSSIQMRLDKF